MKKLLANIAVLSFMLVVLLIPHMNVSAASDPFQTATTIKGIQGDDYSTYGAQHTLQNFRIDKCVIPADYPAVKSGAVKPYYFEGENFYFSLAAQYNLFQWAKAANSQGVTTSVVFLMGWDEDGLGREYLIDEASREPGHTYYAPATSGYGEKTIRAFWSWVMDQCEAYGCHIDNFILGNEVNMPNSWHYSGGCDGRTAANKYADAFYDMYSIVSSKSTTARCSISVDHSWNNDDEGRGVSARDFIRMFNDRLSTYSSNINWHISMHLYPAMLYETRIWTQPEGLNPKSSDARIVDGNNLSYITSYIRDTYGEQHRIMLTEQGFTSYCGDDNQAAALTYSYYAAMSDPMVDCFILNVENAGDKLDFRISGKLAEEIYYKIENGNEADAKWIDSVVLPIIGVDSWSQIIPNYVSSSTNGMYLASDGNWRYYRNGKIDWDYTGMACNEYGWWYFNNGSLDWNYTGMACNEYGWWYYQNGNLDWNYTGMACNEYGWWYYQNGNLDWNYTGMACNEYGWWYYQNGNLDRNYTGMACNEYGWWYYQNGNLDWNYTGMACNEYGWWYFNNGSLDWNYTGMACNEKGWWYYQNGQLDWGYTGMALNEYGWWYYQNGNLDWNYTGMACNENGWWYYQDGRLDWNYTGIGYNEYGGWYYQNGNINFDYTGNVDINGTSYYIVEGHVA
jgi:hypothetical protein